MTNQTKDFCKRLNIKFSDELVPSYKKGKELYAAKGLFAVNKSRITFPTKSTGSAVYGFLFKQKGIVDPTKLPENSSMHIKVKQYLAAGNIFHEKGGVRLF